MSNSLDTPKSVRRLAVPPCHCDADLLDLLYVSAVTFSTLGYRDFQPCERARLWAAAEALLGDLHLGLIVGVVLVVYQDKGEGLRRSLVENPNSPDQAHHQARQKAAGDDR